MKAVLSALLLCIAAATAQDFGWVQSEAEANESYQIQRFTECSDFVQTCPLTISSCATAACKNCQGLGAKPINSCCQYNDAVGCFESYVATATNGRSPSTAAATTTADATAAETGATTAGSANGPTNTGAAGRLEVSVGVSMLGLLSLLAAI